ncbi:MAG: acetoacetate--CoA ligase [Gammaproteobacteria bacterium]|nr:acetoacetate--CoA ligase [Gammaproteobacteria bacterium]
MTSQPLWRPSAARISKSNMLAYARFLDAEYGRLFPDYAALHQWSVNCPEDFWRSIWDFTGVRCAQPGRRVLADGAHFPGARWFPDARLNFAENLLRRRDDAIALVGRLENGARRTLTYAQLHDAVARVAAGLRARGVASGDRVAAFMPNVPETLIAMLATTSIGAVWSSCSPDFGTTGVLDRFGQIAPKVLFACDGYHYNGKAIDTLPRVREIAAHIASIDTLVLVPVLDAETCLPGALAWEALMGSGPVPELRFEQLPFAHPLYILYSSGTTGVPKCIVHSAGGTLLQHLKEHRLHVDLKPDDTLFYFTTCGWMMWNWLASGLASGATLVLYDGSPFHPAPETLIDLIDAEGISIFGTSAKYLSALEKAGVTPRASHRLARLHTVLSTGSPLSHESFRYVYRDFKDDLCLASISGGTDIVSCFVLGNPCLPVWEGEIQCRGLGMAVAIWNDAGAPVVGEKGELVCTRPFPSCPIGFWNDPGDRKFTEAYFSRWTGIWAQGDYGEITPHGGLVIHGRSDAVLNPGGVRIGTAEIYRQVEKIPAVLESVCIGQDWDDDVRVVLFVVLRSGLALDDALRDRIRATIRANATPRHVPARIVQVTDIPRTRSGKIAELAVRQIVHDLPVKNTEALANPEALDLYRGLSALRN